MTILTFEAPMEIQFPPGRCVYIPENLKGQISLICNAALCPHLIVWAHEVPLVGTSSTLCLRTEEYPQANQRAIWLHGDIPF